MANTTTGNNNSSIGVQTLFTNSSGAQNVAHGVNALLDNTSGSNNTGIGTGALSSNTTGSQNTAIGAFADLTGGTTFVNATAIGFNAKVNASNKIRLGDTNVTVIEGQVAYTFPSDERIKININEDIKGLDFIRLLRPVSYNTSVDLINDIANTKQINEMNVMTNEKLNSNSTDKCEDLKIKYDRSLIKVVGVEPKLNYNVGSKYDGDKNLHNGLIAQEVKLAADQSQYTSFSGVHEGNENTLWSIAMTDFIPSLIKSTQELELMIKQLKESNNQLQSRVLFLEEKLK